MSLAGILAAGRRSAEARMGAIHGASDCIVRLRSAAQAQDEATGRVAHQWTVLWSGPMRLAGTVRGASTQETKSPAHVETEVAVRVAHLPISAAELSGIEDGALIEITAGRLVGTVWRVIEATDHDQDTARRLPVVEVSRPDEWASA